MGRLGICGAWVYGKSLSSFQFCCIPKTAPKNIMFITKKKKKKKATKSAEALWASPQSVLSPWQVWAIPRAQPHLWQVLRMAARGP